MVRQLALLGVNVLILAFGSACSCHQGQNNPAPGPRAVNKRLITQRYAALVPGQIPKQVQLKGNENPVQKDFSTRTQVIVLRDDMNAGDYMLYVSPLPGSTGTAATIEMDCCDFTDLATEGIANCSLVSGWAVMTRGWGLPPMRTKRVTTGRPSRPPFTTQETRLSPQIDHNQHPPIEAIADAGYLMLVVLCEHKEYFFLTNNDKGAPITLYAINQTDGSTDFNIHSPALSNDQFVIFDDDKGKWETDTAPIKFGMLDPLFQYGHGVIHQCVIDASNASGTPFAGGNR